MDGPWFRLITVAGTAWASGQVFHGLTGFPPLLAALLTGILARNLGYLDMREYYEIDVFLRYKKASRGSSRFKEIIIFFVCSYFNPHQP